MSRLLVHLSSAFVAIAACACSPSPAGDPPPPPTPTEHAPTRVELVRSCGDIPLGGRTEATLRLHAPATRDVTARVRVTQFLRLSLPEPDENGIHTASVPAGGSKDVAIGCRGEQLGGFAADVELEFVEEARTRAITVTGHVRGASLQLNPRVIDFGDVAVFPGREVKTWARRSIVMRNEGNASLHFDSEKPFRVEFLDGTAAAEFTARVRGGASHPLAPDPGRNALELEVGLSPTSAGKREALLYIESDDPRAPTKAVRIQANAVELPPCDLEVTPSSIDFGQLASGEVAKRTVQLRNVGTAPEARCLVSGVRVEGANAFFTSAAESLELSPGAVTELELSAVSHGTPEPAGRVVTGALKLLVSNPDLPERSIPLSAELSAGCIELSSPALRLDAIGPACAVRESLALKNVCAEPVKLVAIDPPDAPFTLVQTPAIPSAGLQLAPGEQVLLSVRYAPEASGVHEGSVPVQLDIAGAASTWQLPVRGISIEGPMHTDTFVLPEPMGPDLLLVIDNGAPLTELMASVRQNLAGFAKYAHHVGLDARIGVTTTAGTSGYARAELVPDALGETLLRTNDSDFESRFNQLIAGLTIGASNHDVLATAVEAASSAQMMVRDAAPLSIIVVTAARDRSPWTVESYQWQLERLKPGRRMLVTFAAIAPFSNGNSCTAEEDDGRFTRLVQMTNGVREDICIPDWMKSLESLGTVHFGWRHMFWLSRPIDPFRGATKLRIDGIEIPSVDERGATLWSVRPDANGIEFEPIYVPEPGQVTEITYPVACWE